MVITPIASTAFATSVDSSNYNSLETNDSHIIEGVPLITEEKPSRCPYISATMIFQYYGINTTVSEVLHHSGGGYSFTYTNLYPLRLWSGYMFSVGPDDRSFLADLFGLSYNNWYTISKTRSDECWEEYWARVKHNITRDIPVMTLINMNELNNDPNEIFYPDVIVLVGFNESNETVCCHIPNSGSYIYYPKENLKNAIFQIYLNDKISRTIYCLDTFENISKPPLPKEECFLKAHKRNIERMKGNRSAYDQEFFGGLRIFGINALENLKRDCNLLNFVLFNLLPDSHFLSPWTSIGGYWMIYEEKYEISQYLRENQNLSPEICYWDAQHLELESNLILHLAHLLVKLNQTIYNNTFFKAITKARPIIKDIKSTIDTIISVEKAIIEK